MQITPEELMELLAEMLDMRDEMMRPKRADVPIGPSEYLSIPEQDTPARASYREGIYLAALEEIKAMGGDAGKRANMALADGSSLLPKKPAPAHVGDPGILVDALQEIHRRANFGGAIAELSSKALTTYAASVPPTAPDPERVRKLETVARLADDFVSAQTAGGIQSIKASLIKELEALNGN